MSTHLFSERLERAINVAAKAHSGQTRRTKHAWPFVSHAFNVAVILLKYDFSEDVIIAGLFHDLLEDTTYTADQIEEGFGKNVQVLVEAVTDTPGISHKEKDEHHQQIFSTGSNDIKAVKAADILHNLYSKVVALREGENIWAMLRDADSKESYARYDTLVTLIKAHWDHPLIAEIEHYLKELAQY